MPMGRLPLVPRPARRFRGRALEAVLQGPRGHDAAASERQKTIFVAPGSARGRFPAREGNAAAVSGGCSSSRVGEPCLALEKCPSRKSPRAAEPNKMTHSRFVVANSFSRFTSSVSFASVESISSSILLASPARNSLPASRGPSTPAAPASKPAKPATTTPAPGTATKAPAAPAFTPVVTRPPPGATGKHAQQEP